MAVSCSIIVPAYNEARCIEATLRKICASPIEKDIIVVDDGSTDDTKHVLARLARQLPFRLITHRRNLGKGAAIRSAASVSRGDVLLIQDADLEYDPGDYPRLLDPLAQGRGTIVYGSRVLGAYRAVSRWHRFGNRLLTEAVNVLFRASLTDVGSGYKVFPRELVAPLSLRSSGFEFDVELTCKLLRRGARIIEVPVSYQGRSYAEGKKITWKDGLKSLWVILCCRFNPGY